MLRDIVPRVYQQTILASCVSKNCLVVLPTGMGKTLIALLLAVQRLKQYPLSKILVLSPTRPLVEQHLNTFKQYLNFDASKMVLFTGLVGPEKRKILWKDAQIIFSTPQGLENDIISGRISFENVSLIVFDECHKAVGDYAYVFLGKNYCENAKFPRILALTASPGSEIDKIKEVCKNLSIENIEVRTHEDHDVKEYVKEIDVEWLKLELPDELKKIQGLLKNCCKSKLEQVRKYGLIRATYLNKSELLRIQGQLHAKIAKGEMDFEVLKSISLLAEVMKTQHALELLETQGISALHSYFIRFEGDAKKTKTKAVKNLMKDMNFCTAIIKTKRLFIEGVEHPKIGKLKEMISEELEKNPNAKIIIFNQFRDSASKIVKEINSISEDVNAELFVGQMKKSGVGLSQKRQAELLNEFKLGLFNVLISTSVGEEGLDIPKVDLVIFYEPIPSAIRHIQRRGRTGRQAKGKVIVLVAKGTRDEAYKWVALHKEKKMFSLLKDLKQRLNLTYTNQTTLTTSFKQKTKETILVDYREKGSAVMKKLIDNGVNLKLRKLNCADFVLSGNIGIEYKSAKDFADSIIDGRLLKQAKAIKTSFPRPLIIVEGDDFYSVRKIHPNAVNGMLATLMVNFGIPVLRTKNAGETASLLHMIAKKEQEKTGGSFNVHGDRKPLTLKEQQEFIISALPGIGTVLNKPLLKKFRSVKNIVNASEEELKKVSLIGAKKAKAFRELFETEYKD